MTESYISTRRKILDRLKMDISDGNPEKNYNTWMADLPDSLTRVPLPCLAIPGSHDSGSYLLHKNMGVANDKPTYVRWLGRIPYVKSVLYNFSKTQDYDLYNQLQFGIRYLDIRVSKLQKTGEIRLLHGLYGEDVTVVMQQVKSFIDENEKEFVFLDFNHFYNMDQENHTRLLQTLKDMFSEKLYEYNNELDKLTLENVWKTRKRIMIFYHSNNNFLEFWPGKFMVSPWPNTTNPSVLRKFLDKKYKERKVSCINNFFVFQGLLTPTAGHVVWYFYGSLRGFLAPRAKETFIQWLNDKEPGSIRHPGINISIADFVHENNFIPSVINLNKKLLHQKQLDHDLCHEDIS